MKTVYLHIGLHKTGSTTLQHFLHQNQKTLSSLGYLYPDVGIPPRHSGQHNLAWIATKDRRCDDNFGTWEDFHKVIEESSSDRIVISSEDFETIKLKKIKIYREFLKPYDVKVIAYLKRQDKILESLYCQLIKMGACSQDISDFCDENKHKYNYVELLKPWTEIFGQENIIVKALESSQISNICHNFLNILGIKEFNRFEKVQDQNLRFGVKTLSVLKLVNALYKVSINRSPEAREKFTKAVHKKLVKLGYKYWSDNEQKYNLLPYNKAVEIVEEFKESNLQVAREYLGRKQKPLFLDPLEPYISDRLDVEVLSNQEMLTIIFSLLEDKI